MNENTSLSPKVRIIPARSTITNTPDGEESPKLRVAGYARVSTLEAHQSTSQELQVSYYEDYIKKNPAWTFYKVYADHGITGTNTKDRTQFMEMIQDAKDGKIDYIITKSISRFARNTLDCLHYIRLLKGLDKPVGVYFEKEKLDTLDSKSEFFLTLLSSMAQEESRAISENTTWSVVRQFQRGNAFIPTTYFLGYDTDEDGEIVVDEEQAEIVRYIFRLFLEGKGTNVIAKILTEEGRETARGKTNWTSYAVYKILKQEKYMGHCLAQKSVTVDYLSHKRVRNLGIKPQYLIKDCLPAIISEEDFHEVQQEIKRRSNMLRDPDGVYRMRYSGQTPFSNKLFCGECGRPVTRRRLTSRNYKFTVWHCRVASKRDPDFKDCKSKYVWEEEAENAFMRILYEMKEDKEKVMDEVEHEVRICSLNEEEEQRLEELRKQIEVINDRISDLASRNPSKNDSIYEATMRNIIYEQEILKIEFDRLEDSKQEGIYLEKQAEELLYYLEEIEEDDLFRDDIFNKTVEKGIVYENRDITFVFKCGIRRTESAVRVRKR